MSKKKIGIDLGTTNTTIAYYDEALNKLEKYELDDKAYIPSVIAYRKIPQGSNTDIIIGQDAKYYAKDANYYYYEFSQFDILKNHNEIKYLQHDKTHLEVVLDFVHILIKEYKKNNKIQDSRLETIVLAVPNSVILDKGPTSLNEQLNRFLRNEAKSFVLVSEPECACAFFYDKYCKNENFEGTACVIDYGGGRLDASLCKLTYEKIDGEYRPTINIIKSDTGKTDGAGVAFVTELTKRVTKYAPNDADFESAMNAVEEAITNSEEFKKNLLMFYARNCQESHNKKLPVKFDIKSTDEEQPEEECGIRCSDAEAVFEYVNRAILVDALNKILDGEEIVDDVDKFRILSVGGFSNLACVDKEIAEKIDASVLDIGRDPRFVNLANNDKYYSIAYGAALFASRMVVQSTKSPIKISVKSYGINGENENVLLSEGTELSIDEPQWSNNIFEIRSLDDVRVRISISSGKDSKSYEFECDITKAISKKGRIRLGVCPSTYELCVQYVDSKEGFDTVDLSNNVINYINATEESK